MAQLTIDLSGRAGLPSRSGTDIHKRLTEPHLRYLASEGQMVEGVYNPFRLYGYISPVTHSTRGVTAATGSFTNNLDAQTYDVKNNDIYYGGKDLLWKSDGLDDTTLAQAITSIGFTHDIEVAAFAFKNDGTRLFVGDTETPSTIYQFDLSTAWDLSTINYNGVSFDISQQANPRGLAFKGDGTKFFVAGSDDVIYEYDIDVAWDIDRASYSSNSYDVTSEVSGLSSFSVSDNGEHMYVATSQKSVSDPQVHIQEYSLSSAWDISTVSAENDVNVDSEITAPDSLHVRDNGDDIIVGDTTNNDITSYNLTSSWDIETAVLPRTSINFDSGDSDNLSITDGNQTNLELANNSTEYTTIELWVKVDSAPTSGNTYYLVDKLGSGAGYRLEYKNNSGTLEIVWTNSGSAGSFEFSLTKDLGTGTWNHIAVRSQVTSDGSESMNTEIFINATKELDETTTSTGGTGYINSSQDFTLSDSSSTLDGSLFDVRVWSDQRTSTEISNNYQSFVSSSAANLEANWLFDDPEHNDNTNVLDETSNSNDLTQNNSPTFPNDVPSWAVKSDAPVVLDVSSEGTPEAIKIDNSGGDLFMLDRDAHTLFEYDLSSTWDITSATYNSENVDFGVNPTTNIADVHMYQIDGRNAVYFSYETDSSGGGVLENQIGLYDLERDTQNDDWMHNDASSAPSTLPVAPFFRSADNGLVYAFTDTKVYKIDGTTAGGADGAMTEVLSFGGEMYIDDAVDYRGNMYIPIHRGEGPTSNQNYDNECGVYIWDRLSAQSRMRDYIRIQGAIRVRAIWVGHDGNLMATTEGANQKAQLRQFTGKSFKIVHEFDRDGHPPSNDAVTQGPSASWWTAENGRVYSYGSIGPGDDNSFYDFGELLPTTNLTVGTLFYGGNSAGSVSSDNWGDVESFYVTYDDDGTPTAKLWAPHANKDGDYSVQSLEQGDVYTPIKYLNQMSTLKNVEIYCAPTDSSGSTVIATLKFYANQSSTAFASKDITLDDANRGYVDIDLNKPYANSFQMEIEWNTSQALDDDVFAPAQAVLFYEPTNTRG